ncbi:hypothetical protein ACJZ2D_014348 [Fusarium nematophilum]
MESTDNGDDIADIVERALDFSNQYVDKKYECKSHDNKERMLDLERCIQHFQQVVALTAPDDRRRVLGFRGLGEAYLDMFNETGNMEDADKSIKNHIEAMRLTPDDDIGRLNTLKQMGKTYYERYQQAYQATDRDRCIKSWESFIHDASAALAAGNDPEDTGLFDTEWIHWCGLLGDLYHERYLDRNDKADLERAIDLMHQSINQEPEGERCKGTRMFRLGVAFGNRHQATGNIDDLHQCIALYKEARSLLPQDHRDTPGLMRGLSTAYRDRHLRTGSLEDIDLSVQYAEAAIGFTQGNESNRAGRLGTLGSVYEDRYRRSRDVEDLKMSLQCKESALKFISNDDHQRPELLSKLANGYAMQFSRTNAAVDLNRSIDLNQEVLALTPEDHSIRPYCSNNLGMNYHARFKHENEQFMGQPAHLAHLIQRIDTTDLEHSIQLKVAALKGTPSEDPSRASRLYGLGEGYEYQYYVTDDESDWEKALHFFEEALACDSSPAQDPLTAGLYLISMYARSLPPRWPEAYKAASTTMELIPLLASPSLETSDKLLLLDRAAGLGPDFAAIALNCGKSPLEVLQCLEQGRGIISKFKNGLRVHENRLREAHPDLADEFARLRAQTEGPPTTTSLREPTRYEAGKKLEALIMEIHGKPGFDSGVPTMSEDELRAAAERGPIVTINTTPFRCDALIVDRSGTWALPLPHVKYEELEAHASGDRGSPKVLEWLWDNLAEPVLDKLGFTQMPIDGCWPHVWWIPTGVLSNLPLHAAGKYSQRPYHGVLDRVISSYSSTIHMLLHTRSRPCAAVEPPNGEKIVLVAMDKTPGHGDLEFASQEVAREGLHHAVRGLRNQWIKRGRSRGAEAAGTYEVATEGQNPSWAQRTVKPESGPRELFWIPLVHFGV